MENPTILLRRLNPYCTRGLEAVATLCQTRHYGLTTHIEEGLFDALMPDTSARNIDSLLNQQILPVLSQPLLTQMAAQQKPKALTLGWDEEEGGVMEFGGPSAL